MKIAPVESNQAHQGPDFDARPAHTFSTATLRGGHNRDTARLSNLVLCVKCGSASTSTHTSMDSIEATSIPMPEATQRCICNTRTHICGSTEQMDSGLASTTLIQLNHSEFLKSRMSLS